MTTDVAIDNLPILETAVEPVSAPRINLLPPEISERQALRRLKMGLAGLVVASVAAVGGLYVHAGSGRAAAQADLDTQQAAGARLQRQVSSLASAKQAQQQAQNARQALVAAMSSEVLWSKYLDQLRLQLPDGVRYSSVAISGAGSAGSTPSSTSGSTSSSSGATATTPGALATVTITGKAVGHDQVAALMDQLGTVPGLANVYLTSTSSEGSSAAAKVLQFTVSADVTSTALSNRYATTNGTGQ